MKTNAKKEYNNIFVCVLRLSKCHTVLKKTQKMPLRILPKCSCVPIVVMSRNEFEDGIAVDTGWF